MIERLERRKLLAAINLVGTTGVENIAVFFVNNLFRVSNIGATTVSINGSSTIAPNTSKNYANIDTFTVDVGAGNDNIAVDATVTIRTTLGGGKGNDTLRGGAGKDSLGGGDGNDQLFGNRGGDTISGAAGNDFIRGGSSNDVIFGDATTAGSDTIFGDDGADTISAGPGGDAVYGDDNDADKTEDGADSLSGGDGVDFLNGNGGADTVNGDGGDDFISNIDGSVDSIDGGNGNDRSEPDTTDGDTLTNVEVQQSLVTAQNLAGFFAVFDGTTGDDTITLSQSGEVLNFTFNTLPVSVTLQELRDLAEQQSGNEQLFGVVIRADAGNDTVTILTPITLALEVYGDTGNDTLTGSSGNERLNGGENDDLIDGGDGNDRIIGGSESDDLTGGNGKDTLQGDGSDDRNGNENGSRGADRISGDAQTDTVTYEEIDDGTAISVSLDNVANDGTSGEGDNVIQDVNIIVGGSGDDSLVGTVGNQTINGGDGNDTILGLDGDDVLIGDTANDAFGGNDSIDGGEGNDTVNGGEDEFDADTLMGGEGLDTIDYSLRTRRVAITFDNVANDGFPDFTTEDDNVADDFETILSGDGNDTLAGTSRANLINGGDGDDLVNAGGGNDIIQGGDGEDELNGGNGNDTIDGGDGADVIGGGAGTDTADYSGRSVGLTIVLDNSANDGASGEGDDVNSVTENVFGGSAGDNITGNLKNNVIFGNAGGDTIFGVAGNDSLVGGENSDMLFGGSGNDTLRGNGGADTMQGNSGNDRFFNIDNDSLADQISGGGDIDTADNGDADGDDITDVENIVG